MRPATDWPVESTDDGRFDHGWLSKGLPELQLNDSFASVNLRKIP